MNKERLKQFKEEYENRRTVLKEKYGIIIPDGAEEQTLREFFGIKGDYPEGIDDAGFSFRTNSCLYNFLAPPMGESGKRTDINSLLDMTVGQLLRIRNLGSAGTAETIRYLEQLAKCE